MNRRIKDVGSYKQRKKNINDPLVNPVKFFRSVGDEKGVSIQNLSKKVVSGQAVNPPNLIIEGRRQEQYPD